VRRAAAVALVLALLAGCGADDGGDEEATPETTTTTEAPTSARDLRQVDLVPGLLRRGDFPDRDRAVAVLEAGDFSAVGEGQRITVCGQDIRADLDAVGGRFSQFRDDPYSVVHTVTALPEPQAATLLARFEEVAGSCERRWQQPDPNGGRLTREVLGGFPLEDIGVEAVAFLVGAQNQRGRDEAMVMVARAGPFVASLTVTGPAGDRFQIVRRLSHAVGRRLLGLESQVG
jgi:hypothetical protein